MTSQQSSEKNIRKTEGIRLEVEMISEGKMCIRFPTVTSVTIKPRWRFYLRKIFLSIAGAAMTSFFLSVFSQQDLSAALSLVMFLVSVFLSAGTFGR